jgi:WhiB family redox-sensing transcriptional regulator
LESVDEFADDWECEGEMPTVDDFVWELKNNTSEWKWDAACQGMGPEIFYLEQGEKGENTRRLQAARQVCNGCLVRRECLQYALDNYIGTGIWAGTTPNQRKRLRSERAS